jgi:hypothetical protein
MYCETLHWDKQQIRLYIFDIVPHLFQGCTFSEYLDDSMVNAHGVRSRKQCSQRSLIRWETKNLLFGALPYFGRYVKQLFSAAFAVVSTHQPALGSRGGLLCLIRKEGLCPSSGVINRLMMMMIHWGTVVSQGVCDQWTCFDSNNQPTRSWLTENSKHDCVGIATVQIVRAADLKHCLQLNKG